MTLLDAIDLLMHYETPSIQDMEKEDDILEWVAAFVGSNMFHDRIDEFCEEHGNKFTELLTSPSLESYANKCEWLDLHKCFVDTANSAIEAFLVEHSFTMDQYNARCEEVMRASEQRHRRTQMSCFVQMLMACTEYSAFLMLMRRAADPEYDDKKQLQLQAEQILNKQESEDQQRDESAPVAAQHFLDYCAKHPTATLQELTSEFQSLVLLN